MLSTDSDKEKPAQIFQMEWRQCPGCPQEFKVLTTSKQIYHSRACELQSGGKATTPIKKKPWESLKADQKKHGAGVTRIDPPSLAYEPPKAKPVELKIETVNSRDEAVLVTSEPHNEQKEPETLLTAEPLLPESPPEEMLTVDSTPMQMTEMTEELVSDTARYLVAETRWQSYVDRGRSLISKMGRDRLAVADLAFDACEILHGGGGHWRDFEGIYTMKRVAEEIGIAYKTLANWVRVKRNVYDKLISIGIDVDPTQDWAAMTRVADRCDIKDTPQQVLKKFRANSQKKNEPMNPERYFLQGLRRIRSLNHYLTHHNPKKKSFDSEDLKELKALCRSISRWIDS